MALSAEVDGNCFLPLASASLPPPPPPPPVYARAASAPARSCLGESPLRAEQSAAEGDTTEDIFALCQHRDLRAGVLRQHLQQHPEEGLRRDRHGRVGLHVLCSHKPARSALLQEYLRCCPAAATAQDAARGFTPMHTVFEDDGKQPRTGWQERYAQPLLPFMQHSPEASLLADKTGKVPLHHICDSSSVSHDLIGLYLRHRPKAGTVQSDTGKTALHSLANNNALTAAMVAAYLQHCPTAATISTAGDRPCAARVDCWVRVPLRLRAVRRSTLLATACVLVFGGPVPRPQERVALPLPQHGCETRAHPRAVAIVPVRGFRGG